MFFPIYISQRQILTSIHIRRNKLYNLCKDLMHTTRLNVNEGDSCVSLYAVYHSRSKQQYHSTRGRICNFYYDPIIHVMGNIIDANKCIMYANSKLHPIITAKTDSNILCEASYYPPIKGDIFFWGVMTYFILVSWQLLFIIFLSFLFLVMNIENTVLYLYLYLFF